MNRRLCLAKAVAWVGALLGISTVSAEGDVGIPVEDCPCCCTADEGVTWYSCDEAGNPLPGDPAGCESNGLPPGYEWPIDQDTPEYETPDYQTQDEDAIGTEHEEVNWSAVELPNTGSGPQCQGVVLDGYCYRLHYPTINCPRSIASSTSTILAFSRSATSRGGR